MAYYEIAQEVFKKESEELQKVAARLNNSFDELVNMVADVKGRIILIGTGKSELIAKKIAASLSSIGFPSFAIDAGTTFHGDLGRIAKDDLVFFVSNSGETQEVVQALFALQNNYPDDLLSIALTGNLESTLAKNTKMQFDVGVSEEVDVTKMAPTASTTAVLVFGDALLTALEEKVGFTRRQFAKYHPGGSIGKMLLQRVKHVMHTKVPYVNEDTPINEVIYTISDYGIGLTLVRELGTQKIIGIITDGDIRKKFLNISSVKKSSAKDYMTYGFVSIDQEERNREAWRLMARHGISNLIVTDSQKEVVGVVTIHEVL
ncbi:KpsF/GutQ family sugar-phosphate isomerase [Ligilactobacillus sp. WILCCON 0076]|uniref:KpsF/GutQ family sugar-phosphate isomerase n=1 Tax=Ligilactobacillus ubinensis TaxID=2876789 RepID=A0A9X2FLI7_9LACO|nr:KpsF/GutQ family sugar-phosphate isomerase [Ligilactobacillus ubinensis]MCP0887485.1 KpsF/GutQ family sugar-phosphate isomerase [Ligilactobacillus ubinensis]